jgi:hypothetical protein
MPKRLGVGVMIAGAGHVARTFASRVLPNLAGVVGNATGIMAVGELLCIVWLPIRGARVSPEAGAPVMPPV